MENLRIWKTARDVIAASIAVWKAMGEKNYVKSHRLTAQIRRNVNSVIYA